MLATNCDLCWLAISSSRLFWAISLNRRALRTAIADWAAKASSSRTISGENTPGSLRLTASAPIKSPWCSRGTASTARTPA